VSAAGVETPSYSIRVPTAPLNVTVGVIEGVAPDRTLTLTLAEVSQDDVAAPVTIDGCKSSVDTNGYSLQVPSPRSSTGMVPLTVIALGKVFSSFVAV
jgi:hypothetical protein